jgi:hypothetical protein
MDIIVEWGRISMSGLPDLAKIYSNDSWNFELPEKIVHTALLFFDHRDFAFEA